MAKKKTPKRIPGRVRDVVTAIHSSLEWKEWVGRLAEFDRVSSVSELTDRAFVAYAKQIGFEDKPPKR